MRDGQSSRLKVLEKIGYAAGDAAANFVFMSMVLFQAAFYTEVFGLRAKVAAVILLGGRLWDALADPIVGALADRTRTRWGKFRPWILFTAFPWCAVMILAYTTPQGLSPGELIAYAAVTNVVLMSLYSMNNVPYAALGGVITGDTDERSRLNSVRFVGVNLAQFVVSGFTLPLVAKFSSGHDRQYGWHMTFTIWAGVCLVLFLFTFAVTRERVQAPPLQRQRLRDQLSAFRRNRPWTVIFLVTLLHFSILSFRGGALYCYFHYYASTGSMYDWLRQMGLTAGAGSVHAGSFQSLLNDLGLIVSSSSPTARASDIGDVFNSVMNMIALAVNIVALMTSPILSRRFGNRTVTLVGFALTGMCSIAMYFLPSTSANGMAVLTILSAMAYGPTIPLLWAMFADVSDYTEWHTGRQCAGLVFATISFALKCGLAIGSASYLSLMAVLFTYSGEPPYLPLTVFGFRLCGSVVVGVLFLACSALLLNYKLSRRVSQQIADELPAIRRRHSPAALPEPSLSLPLSNAES